jgi:alkanesulfonate monooxygenase SsuD/methylene tetrahydromethanopterin reductase-like flavin-dependent oxidoreductase (luciferase family)
VSVSFEGATFRPGGSGVEIWVAASSSAGLARAARFGDGWLSGAKSVESYAESAHSWHAALAEAGRDPDTVTAGYEVFACIKESHEDAVRCAEASLIDMYGNLAEGLQRAIVGTPAAAIERIQQLVNLGARSFELRLISPTTAEMAEMVDLVAEAVVPAFAMAAR